MLYRINVCVTNIMNTLVLSGSVRSTQENLERLHVLAKEANSIEMLRGLIRQDLNKGATFCNSDILTAIALLAMYQEGATPRPFSLASLFRRLDSELDDELMSDNMHVLDDKQKELISQIEKCDGLLLVTPVYFGDRSSVANKLLQLASKSHLFKNKVFGCASVAAKRNGGQETTIIYCLVEALKHGALIVGNGPPTAQYGGTAVAGHKGTVLGDDWGLTTTHGVASRIVQSSFLYNSTGNVGFKGKLRLLILITMDNSNRDLLDLIRSYVKDPERVSEDVEFVVFDTLKHTIYRCIGCRDCPPKGIISLNDTLSLENHARCVIKHDLDGIHAVHKELIQADAVLVAGLNTKDANDITYRYQVLVERTRYIRRDNFEMTNKLFGSVTLHEVGAQSNSLHSVKTVTSYIRHNVVMTKPIDIYMHNGEVIKHDKDTFSNFVRQAKILKAGRTNSKIASPVYVTGGIGGYDSESV